MDLSYLRSRIRNQQGQEYWRSLEELAGTPEFQERLGREFPGSASEWRDPSGRREFLRLMGASLALAGLAGCAPRPAEKIVARVEAPEDVIPGRPLYYASAMPLAGFGRGILAESHMGRPTKIEGNLLHPSSLGATDAVTQASILDLYDPDRSQVVKNAGRISTWSAFVNAAGLALEKQKEQGGAGIRLLTQTVTSPTLIEQMEAFLAEFPRAVWISYDPSGPDQVRAGARLAFGTEVQPIYRLDRAKAVVSLDADFLIEGPASVRYSRDFSIARRVSDSRREMNRLYVFETTPTLTGALADHRFACSASAMERLTRALAREIGVPGLDPGTNRPPLEEREAKWVEAVARDLKDRPGECVVVIGESQPPAVHALGHALNTVLGNGGRTVDYIDPVEAGSCRPNGSLVQLSQEIDEGEVSFLATLGGNPAFSAPADLGFAERLDRIPFRLHLGLYENETSRLCHWHVPETHFLESWSDIRAHDGTVSIIQPLIRPLYGGRTVHEVLSALTGKPGEKSLDLVKEATRTRLGEMDFEKRWRIMLHDGLIRDTQFPHRSVSLQVESLGSLEFGDTSESKPGLDLVFRRDPAVHDGRFATNPWLQELPRPHSLITWDNPALIAPATAERMGLQSEDLVKVTCRNRSLEVPVWILPGHPENSVTLHFGQGRSRAGRVGTGVGFNVYSLRCSQAPWFDRGATLIKTGRRHSLATTQQHHNMEGRHLVRHATLDEYRRDPRAPHHGVHEFPEDLSLYPEHPSEGNAWGMTIDLNLCTGCKACVLACQSENNIPVVGKEEVRRGREMHWIRIDRYYSGELEDPDTYHQPVLCMHCENAPCETVCPVGATVHSPEGLNEMVYNRCVGTRYCANNCPYKVRRFNFFEYADHETPSLKLMRNPDVTVRSRGVMEKCTYCVQRINAARIDARREGESLRDGDIVTACQSACPVEAIVFGDINDPESRVSRLKAEPRNYGILTELNTHPRTTYLARLRNPNPDLEEESSHD